MFSSESDCRAAERPVPTGFSLVELSVVLVIVSIIAVMGLELTANYMNRTAYKVTAERLDMIDKALVAYRRVNNKLPCPGSTGLTPTSACYGKEFNGSGGAGTCNDTAGACNGNVFAAGVLVSGDVPVRDLGLPLSAMVDGYGNRIYYVVAREQTYNTSYTAGNPLDEFNRVPDAIAVRSGKLDTNCTAGGALCQDRGMASYFLFSVGVDKRGGRTPSGGMGRVCQNTGDAADVASTDGMIDTANCRLGGALFLAKNGSTSITIPDNVFYDSRFNSGTVDTSHFDDLVKWRSKGSL